MKTKIIQQTAFVTADVNINGEKKEVIVAFIDFIKMNAPEPSKDEHSVDIHEDNFLECIFNFAEPEQFWEENIELKDYEGTPIPKDTPDVLVYLTDGTSFWQFPFRNKPLNGNIIKCDSVKDYCKAIGTTNYGTRGMNNIELAGLAYMVTEEQAYKDVYYLTNTYKMQSNTAQALLGVVLPQRVTKAVTIGAKKDAPVSARTLEQAELLYQTNYRIFGEKIAKARYAANAINFLLKQYDFDTVLKAIKSIEFDAAQQIRLAGCNEKENCIICCLMESITQKVVKAV